MSSQYIVLGFKPTTFVALITTRPVFNFKEQTLLPKVLTRARGTAAAH